MSYSGIFTVSKTPLKLLNPCSTARRDFWEGTMSTLDENTIMEGVVMESLSGLRRKAKYVHQAYLEAQ